MSFKHYIPRPVCDTFPLVIDLYKVVHASNNPPQILRQWLSHCLANTTITLSTDMVKDYQWALNFLYHYRGNQDESVAKNR